MTSYCDVIIKKTVGSSNTSAHKKQIGNVKGSIFVWNQWTVSSPKIKLRKQFSISNQDKITQKRNKKGYFNFLQYKFAKTVILKQKIKECKQTVDEKTQNSRTYCSRSKKKFIFGSEPPNLAACPEPCLKRSVKNEKNHPQHLFSIEIL